MAIETSDSFLPVPGGRVFARQWHADDRAGTPIVLLHESLGSVGLWKTFPTRLAAATGRTVIAYDRLGFGQSTPRTAPPSFDFIDEEAETHFPAVARALGIDGCVLFGHSVGGIMALRIAAQRPGCCRAVITESAQARIEDRTLAGIRAAKQAFADPDQFARLERWHGERTRWVLSAWTDIWLDPDFRSWSLDAYLGQVQCPVLALHGDADEYGSTAFPDRITAGVAGPAQMEILAGCGHIPHREQADAVIRSARAFMAAHSIP